MKNFSVVEFPPNTLIHDKQMTPNHATFGVWGRGDLVKVLGYYLVYDDRASAQALADRENTALELKNGG